MKRLMLVVVAAGLTGWADPIAVDFAKDVRPLRRALHSSGFGPMICSQTAQALDDIKSMGFEYARTHDWAIINPNQRVCDYFHIFPLMHLDAKDPNNYVFGPTDYLLTRTREEAGLKVFFRLGTSIEHSGKKHHFNAVIPADYDKLAETFAGTVRHYNRGWANGHNWDIRYWEIWNEPDGIENMWFPPEGIEGLSKDGLDEAREVCRKKFVPFFVTVLKRLKSEFGDTIKVGGPALGSCRKEWFEEIFAACKAAGVAPDFVSWHGYVNNPRILVDHADVMRWMCDKYGFTKCELIVNEWHYFGYDTYNWDELQRCSDPAVKARIWEGPNSHNGIRSSAFTLAQLILFQHSKLDQAYFYGCRQSGAWGFKDEMQRKYKVFSALKLFGDILRDYKTICESGSANGVYTMAVSNPQGGKALLVADYLGKNRTLQFAVSGVEGTPTAKILDHTRDMQDVPAAMQDGVLTLTKADDNSAVFFVKW